jgi:serine/threonine protein kinase
MSDTDALSAIENLFFRWQAHRAAGQPVAPAELCRDRPELLARLERRIAAEFPDDAAATSCHTLAESAVGSAGLPTNPAMRGRYEVAAEHARGGMGRVCVAIDTELNRRVAFKDIQERFADDPGTRQRFVREALITGQLEHPGVIPVYGLGTDPAGRPYYAMRFVEGESLRDAVEEFHRRPPRGEPVGAQAVAFRSLLKRFADVCNAVAFAHSKRIVHRDLKPANVMLGRFGETLVVDWGLARSFADKTPDTGAPAGAATGAGEATTVQATAAAVGDSAGTRTGQVMGSPAYMSPEQSRGDLRTLGPAWDIYSLGGTLYELLTGRPPFAGRSVSQLLKAIQAGELTPVREVAGWVPKPLEAIAHKAMSLDPAARYATALELAAEIERYLADEPVLAHRATPAERVRRWRKRHPVLVRTTAALLLTVTPLLTAALAFVNRERAEAVTARQNEEQARRAEQEAHDQTRGALAREEQAKQQALAALAAEQKALAAEQAALAAKQKALEAEQAARAAEAKARAQARATLDLSTDAVVGKILAKQSRLGPDEQQFLKNLVERYAAYAADVGADTDAKLLAARARLRVAQIRERLGERAAAAREYRTAADALRPFSPAGATDAGPTRDLGTALLGYAASLPRDDWRAWERPMLEGLLIREAAHRADAKNPARLRDTGAALLQGAQMLASVDQRKLAEELYRRLIGAFERVARAGALGVEEAETLGQAYDQLARLEGLSKPPRYHEAYRTLDAAVALFADLERMHPDEPRYRHQRAYARTMQVLLLLRDGKAAEAERVVAGLVDTYRELVRQYPAVREFRFGLSVALDAQVGALDAGGKRAAALLALAERRSVLRRLVAEYPELIDDRADLVAVLRLLEAEYTKDKRLAEAKEAKDEADALEKAAPR